MLMLKRFWNAVKKAGFCDTHNIVSSPVCTRCGYNIVKPVVLGKDRSKSRMKRR